MKLVVQRNDLLVPLQKVIGAIEKRQTMPMLSNVLIKSSGDQLTMTATDLEITLKSTRELSEIQEEGYAVVPARKLFDICKALPENSVLKIKTSEERVTITSGSSRFTLASLPPGDFPVQEEGHAGAKVTLDAQLVTDLLDKTSFAMANQDVRYYLNGLMLEILPEGIRAVATDGHRLAYCFENLDVESDVQNLQVIVPRKGILELKRLIQEEEHELTLVFGNKHIKVISKNGEFISKLIDGRFPDYKRVMPDEPQNHLYISRSVLRDALQRAAILSNEKYRGIRLALSENELLLEAHNAEQEEAEEIIEVEYNDSALQIGFNVQYLLDVTQVLKGSTVRISMQDSSSSALMDDPDDTSARYVVMPMRL